MQLPGDATRNPILISFNRYLYSKRSAPKRYASFCHKIASFQNSTNIWFCGLYIGQSSRLRKGQPGVSALESGHSPLFETPHPAYAAGTRPGRMYGEPLRPFPTIAAQHSAACLIHGTKIAKGRAGNGVFPQTDATGKTRIGNAVKKNYFCMQRKRSETHL